MRFVLAIAAFCLCWSAQAADWQPSLDPAAWEIRYSPSMPKHPVADGETWAFDFPHYPAERLPCDRPCPSVHYVMTKGRPLLTAKDGSAKVARSITLTVEIATQGNVVFQHRTETANTCPTPAHVRLILQRENDDLRREFHRWWAAGANGLELKPGVSSVTVPLEPRHWLSVFGKTGDHDEITRGMFFASLADIGHVGVTLGGGCFYGHGVNVSGGTARLRMIALEINW